MSQDSNKHPYDLVRDLIRQGKLKEHKYTPDALATREERDALLADAYGEDYEGGDNPYGCSWLDIM